MWRDERCSRQDVCCVRERDQLSYCRSLLITPRFTSPSWGGNRNAGVGGRQRNERVRARREGGGGADSENGGGELLLLTYQLNCNAIRERQTKCEDEKSVLLSRKGI